MSKKIVETRSEEVVVYRLVDEYVRYTDGTVSCGVPKDPGQEPEHMVLASEILHTSPNNSLVATALGDSMKDANIAAGDNIILDGDRVPGEGDVVLANLDGELVLKYYHRDKNGILWFIPANKEYRPIMVAPEKYSRVDIMGVMTGIVKNTPRGNARLVGKLEKLCEEEFASYSVDEQLTKFDMLVMYNHDRKDVKRRLHGLIDGNNGVMVVRVLKAAVKVGLLRELPSYSVLKEEFGEVIQNSLFYKEKNNEAYDDKIDEYAEKLRD